MSDGYVAEIWYLGPGAWHPFWSPGQVKNTGGTVSGAWHPLTPSSVPFRGVSATQIMGKVEVIPHVPTAVEQIVVYQCHRSCWNVEVEQLVRCRSHRCSSWLRLMMPVVVLRLVLGRDRAEPVEVPQLQCSPGGRCPC